MWLILWAPSLAWGKLPAAASSGFLPAGIHQAEFSELATRFAATPQRVAQLRRLRQTLVLLRVAGIRRVYVAGSFVGAKPVPGDVDLLFDPRPRRDVDGPAYDAAIRISDARGIHIYPSSRIVENALSLQIGKAERRAWRRRLPSFLEFFQHRRDGAPVGLVSLDLSQSIGQAPR